MAKLTAFTTLSYHGQVIARAGKAFDGKDLPEQVLKGWAAKGWCSPLPPKSAAAANKKMAGNSKGEQHGIDGQ